MPIYFSKKVGDEVVCGCADPCICEDETTSYVVTIDGFDYSPLVLTDVPCTWYVPTGPCGPPLEGDTIEMILFGNSCGWSLTIQYVGVWTMTGTGPTDQPTPVGTYVFLPDASCDLSAAIVTVS